MQILRRLQRVTSGGKYIAEMDGLRFVAIICVMLVHINSEITQRIGHPAPATSFYSVFEYLIENMSRGVLLFFVISGFILGLPFARHALLGGKRVSPKQYFTRRLTRLEPPYLLNILVFALAFAAYNPAFRHSIPAHAFAGTVYLHFLSGGANPLNVIWWTLEVEAQFYILMPLLAIVFCIRGAWLRRSTLLLAIFASALVQRFIFGKFPSTVSDVLHLSILTYIQYFLAGMLLTDIYLTEMQQWRYTWWWDVLAFALWPLVFCVPAPWDGFVLPSSIAVAYIAAFRGRLFRHFFRLPWIAALGGMCYSLYLWHTFVMALAAKATRHLWVFPSYTLNYAVQVSVLLCVMIVSGAAMFVLIERPCMDPAWPAKLRAKLSPASSIPAPRNDARGELDRP